MDLDHQLPTLLPLLREILKDDTRCWRKDDDEFLVIFLRARDYDVDRAASSVRSFYQNIERNHELIKDIRPRQFESVYALNLAVMLHSSHNCAKDGSLVCVVNNLHKWDPSKVKLRSIQQSMALKVGHLMLTSKNVQLKGVSFILDMNGLNLSHVMQLRPREIKRLVYSAQDGVPLKIASIHLINYPSIFWGIYYIGHRLLKAKMRKRTHLHNSFDSLHKCFDKRYLPITLGGELRMNEAMNTDHLEKLLHENKYLEEFYM